MSPTEFEQALRDAQERVFQARAAWRAAIAAAGAAEAQRRAEWLYIMLQLPKDIEALRAQHQTTLSSLTAATQTAVELAQSLKLAQYEAESALRALDEASQQLGPLGP